MKPMFPILLYINGVLTADAHSTQMEKYLENGIFITLDSGKDQQKGWVLDSRGLLAELIPEGKTMEWAKPIAWLWNFTKAVYKVEGWRKITVGELRKLISPIRDRFDDAPIAGDLKRFLRDFPDPTEVTPELLKQWPL